MNQSETFHSAASYGAACFALDAANPGPFAQYLLPPTAARARRNPEQFSALGAVWRGYAVGAAAAAMDEEEPCSARLESLFVDPQARGRGIGTNLLLRAAEAAHARGAALLELSYTLAEPDLEAMDRMVRKLGGEPSFRANAYTVDFSKLHDSPLFGRALSHRFRPSPHVKRFRCLEPAQIARLNENGEIPEYLRPSARKDLLDPALSVAWVEDGEIVSYLLTSSSGPGSYTALSGWSSEKARWHCFALLMASCANLCFYHAGGGFLYHLSAVSDNTERLVLSFAPDCHVRMEEHRAELALPCGGPYSMG